MGHRIRQVAQPGRQRSSNTVISPLARPISASGVEAMASATSRIRSGSRLGRRGVVRARAFRFGIERRDGF
jgi:hypothetical protein